MKASVLLLPLAVLALGLAYSLCRTHSLASDLSAHGFAIFHPEGGLAKLGTMVDEAHSCASKAGRISAEGSARHLQDLRSINRDIGALARRIDDVQARPAPAPVVAEEVLALLRGALVYATSIGERLKLVDAMGHCLGRLDLPNTAEEARVVASRISLALAQLGPAPSPAGPTSAEVHREAAIAALAGDRPGDVVEAFLSAPSPMSDVYPS